MSVLIVDESSFNDANGTPNYPAAKKAGVVGVYIKATEGDFYTNPFFDRDRKLAEAAGLAWGAYHFVHPGTAPAVQWTRFSQVVGSDWGQLRPAFDVEVTDGQPPARVASAAVALSALAGHDLGYPPVIYTFPAFAQAGNCAGLGGDPLWYADVSGSPIPAPWARAVLVQTGQRQVPGIPSAGTAGTDVDVAATLTPLLIPHPVKPVPARRPTHEIRSDGTATYREIAGDWRVPVASLYGENPDGHPVAVDPTHYDVKPGKGVYVFTYAESAPAPAPAPSPGPMPDWGSPGFLGWLAKIRTLLGKAWPWN